MSVRPSQELVEALGNDRRFIGQPAGWRPRRPGVMNACADLYEGCWSPDPRPRTPRGCCLTGPSVKLVRPRREKLSIDDVEHDRAMAVVSHPPHVFANQLAAQGLSAGTERLGALPEPRDGYPRRRFLEPRDLGARFRHHHRGSGRRDRRVDRRTRARQEVIGSADPGRIEQWQAAVGETGAGARQPRPPVATHEPRVLVPNQPGVLAELASPRAGPGQHHRHVVDPVPDISLVRSRLAAGEGEAEKAEEYIARLGHLAAR